MGFIFSLQAVLRVRQGTERERLLALQAANLRVAFIRSQLEDLIRSQAERDTSSVRELGDGVNASQLHFNELCRSACLQTQAKLREELKLCEALRLTRRQEFNLARQQREILDKLREAEFDLYRQEQDRRDQRQMDDALLLHRAFLRQG